MIDRQALLSDLQTLLERLEADLLERSESAEVPDVGRTLRAEYERAKQAVRTAANYEDWRSDAITQAAAAWVLSCVFVRFLEDNHLIEPPKLSGQSSAVAGQQNRLQRARDEHELYFRAHPKLTDRDYILAVFDELAALPGTHEVFGEHNPIRELPNWLSGDAGGELLRFFQKIDANTGALVHDFTDPAWDTRFLGDLYEDLSEAARKKYALLQTPEFVEEFILERTLEPALNEFGLEQEMAPAAQPNLPGLDVEKKERLRSPFRMIDPACGSGHFLLGSFRRILERWRKTEPKANPRDLIQRTLDSIHGVDVNPYAVAIARFRLLLMAMQAEGIKRLADAPAYRIHLAVGDSLMHGRPGGDQLSLGWRDVDHVYHAEDRPMLHQLLAPGRYHAVVANPPYITPKDRALNEEYRRRYPKVCHMKYSLAVPFMQRLFDLACTGGYTGQITTNTFIKAEFGKKLIEGFFPTVDLTHVLDTSGAYIPGHGTPTVVVFGRHRRPIKKTIRTVMGIRGEPSTPSDPAHGLVWSAIVSQIDQPGSQSEFVSAGDSPREAFHSHPWSIGGGGAAELKEQLDKACQADLSSLTASIGITSFTLEDDIYILPENAARRLHLRKGDFRTMVVGDSLRDWRQAECEVAVFPYDEDFRPIEATPCHPALRYLWVARACLSNNMMFGGKTKTECGLKWYEYGRLTSDKLRTPSSIAFAFVATHNHFILDRGGKLFNRTAPIIKLPCDATEEDHLALLGLLNSSTVCFWLKQVCFPKGGDHVGQEGARVRRSLWDERFNYNSTPMGLLPIPVDQPVEFAKHLDLLAQRFDANSPRSAIADWQAQPSREAARERRLRQVLDDAYAASVCIRGEMILIQEDLDWQCYRLYGLIDEDVIVGLQPKVEPPPILPGMRAFEVILAQDLADGRTQTTWFERHGISPRTELPDSASNPKYRAVAERRIAIIRSNREIALIERPEYKRRWYEDIWGNRREEALRDWLSNKLESYFDFDGRMSDGVKCTAKLEIALTSVARLADIARQDADFMEVGEVYRDDRAFNVDRLVGELVEAESVPLLPVQRYKPSGLRKRAEWEQTWDLQREEDRTGRRLDIPVPPKYTSADFLKSDYWRLRGKLDVPKERWISFPHCEGLDGTLMIAWAGYDHLQLARSISSYFVDIQERLGGRDDPRLVPLLACLLELIPWLKQWHNEVDTEFGERMGDYFEGFVNEEARQLGKTIPEIKAWQPPQRAGGRGRRGGG